MTTEQLNILFETVDTNIDEPNVDRLWQDRLTRNDEVIQNVLPGLIKNISNKQNFSSKITTKEDFAAVCIQKHVRAFLAKKLFVILLQEKFEKDEEERRLKQMEQVEEGELLVQNHLLRRDLEDDLIVVRNVDLRFEYAASIIQQAWRKYLTRKKDFNVD